MLCNMNLVFKEERISSFSNNLNNFYIVINIEQKYVKVIING